MLGSRRLIHIPLCDWGWGREINILKILGATVQNLVARASGIPTFAHIWIGQFATVYKYFSIFGKLFAVTVLNARFALQFSLPGSLGVSMYICVGPVAQSV